MKHGILTLLATLCLTSWGCAGNQAGLQKEIDRLKAENQQLKQQNEALTSQLVKLHSSAPAPRDDIEVAGAKITPSDNVHVTVQRDGSIVVDGEALTIEELPDRLTKVYQENRQTQVVLHTESGVPYQRVVEVLDVVSAIGFDRLAMDTEE